MTAIMHHHDADDRDDSILAGFDSDLARLDSEAEAILKSIRNDDERNDTLGSDTPPARFENDSLSTCSHSEDDIMDDDEMNDEILRLGSVVASLQQDLDNMNDVLPPPASMLSTTSSSADNDEKSVEQGSDVPHNGVPAIDKRSSILNFILTNNLYGPGVGGQEVKLPLVAISFVIWFIVILLVIHVRTCPLDEYGKGLTLFPKIGFV